MLSLKWRQYQLCGVFFVIILSELVILLECNVCDDGTSGTVLEGNLGRSDYFPWLGVIKVNLRQNFERRVAVTGIVLIKEKFVLANADDIIKIPTSVFLKNSEAMFIPSKGITWSAKLKDYRTHPEHGHTTINTIAVVELELKEFSFVPFRPICLPQQTLETPDHLYAIGFQDGTRSLISLPPNINKLLLKLLTKVNAVDYYNFMKVAMSRKFKLFKHFVFVLDNNVLEKHLYKLTYMDKSVCKEFYGQSGLLENKMAPTHTFCGYSNLHNSSCLWDTGMVLASNATGKNWNLIGFGIHGPGCAAPARFIDIFPYLPWIKAATTLVESNNQDGGSRRSAFNMGFQNKGKNFEEVPIYKTFNNQPEFENPNKNARRQEENGLKENIVVMDLSKPMNDPYQMNYEPMKYFIVDRLDAGAINVERFDEEYEKSRGACKAKKVLIYRDKMRIVDVSGGHNFAAYRVGARTKFKPLLWYTTYIDDMEGLSWGADRTPKNLLKRYRDHAFRLSTTPHPKGNWRPGLHMEFPSQDEFLLGEISQWNINLLIKLSFVKEAQMNVSVYGPPQSPIIPTKPTTVGADGTSGAAALFPSQKDKGTFYITGADSSGLVVHGLKPTITWKENQIPRGMYRYYQDRGDYLKYLFPRRNLEPLKKNKNDISTQDILLLDSHRKIKSQLKLTDLTPADIKQGQTPLNVIETSDTPVFKYYEGLCKNKANCSKIPPKTFKVLSTNKYETMFNKKNGLKTEASKDKTWVVYITTQNTSLVSDFSKISMKKFNESSTHLPTTNKISKNVNYNKVKGEQRENLDTNMVSPTVETWFVYMKTPKPSKIDVYQKYDKNVTLHKLKESSKIKTDFSRGTPYNKPDKITTKRPDFKTEYPKDDMWIIRVKTQTPSHNSVLNKYLLNKSTIETTTTLFDTKKYFNEVFNDSLQKTDLSPQDQDIIPDTQNPTFTNNLASSASILEDSTIYLWDKISILDKHMHKSPNTLPRVLENLKDQNLPIEASTESKQKEISILSVLKPKVKIKHKLTTPQKLRNHNKIFPRTKKFRKQTKNLGDNLLMNKKTLF